MIINSNVKYIHPDVIQKLHDASNLTDVISDFVVLKPSGASKIGDCPACGGKKKLSVTESKHIWKCFKCDIGGKNAMSFLSQAGGKTFIESGIYLADKYSIDLNEKEDKPNKKKKQKNRKVSFRDAQLKESGIPDKYQTYFAPGVKNSQHECNRYQSSTKDKFNNIVAGDDMVLHYLDLDGHVLMYKDKKGNGKPLTRVRWANPALHLDKDGNPMKYASPYGSGSQLWIPNWTITAYRKSEIIETLIVCEGEKKADALCLAGIPAVGVQGINNLARGGAMPAMFELIIKRCAIANIVFLLDSDWQDISIKNNKAVDQRPKSFYYAVSKFRNYFTAFAHEGYDLKIFLAHGKDPVFKGIDDVLVRELKGKETELVDDFKDVLKGRTGVGKYIDAYDITGMSDYKMKEYWSLHSIPAFIKAHFVQLKELQTFKIGKLTRRYNEETDEFEIDEKILPQEQFWRTSYGKTPAQDKTQFLYQEMRIFLKNRGYGQYKSMQGERRFVSLEGKVVTEIDHKDVEDFILQFLEEINEKEALEMILKGGSQYLGPNNLGRIYNTFPEFQEPEKDCQYLFFKNVYWKISADGIEEKPLKSAPKNIWNKEVINFSPKYSGKPMLDIKRSKKGWGAIEKSPEADKCEFFNFIDRTSRFHWKKEQRLIKGEEGKSTWSKYPMEEVSDGDIKTYRNHLAAKMLSTGYVAHSYRNYGELKAIIAMDGLLSEVGKSQGGSGKSIWATCFEHLQPTVVVDAKKKNIEEDKFIYDDVDERTKTIVYDDCRVNIPFEHFFSQITRGIQPEKKGLGKTTLPPVRMIFTTNHAINLEGNSFERRVYYIGFSDYYNEHRTVGDDFGHQLFREWDWEQWNLYYNFMATCIQFYFKNEGLKHKIQGDDLQRRKLRQQIGENFIEWMETLVEDGGILLNKKLEKMYITKRYLEDYPGDRRYMNPKKMKEKIKKYCKYAGFDFNPSNDGERLRVGGQEFLIIGDKTFDANKVAIIAHDSDWIKEPIQGPF